MEAMLSEGFEHPPPAVLFHITVWRMASTTFTLGGPFLSASVGNLDLDAINSTPVQPVRPSKIWCENDPFPTFAW